MTEKELIIACQKGDRRAQKLLFDRYGGMLKGLCRRYFSRADRAEDVFIEAMYKILTKLDQYSGKGSFEGWMRRVAVNEVLMEIRRNKSNPLHHPVDWAEPSEKPAALEKLKEDDILALLDQLPDGYRTVFNLYAIEGYKHREIAEMLGISIHTSKSQFLMARKKMMELVEKIK